MSLSSLETEKWCIDRTLYNFNGFWFTENYLQGTKRVLESFKPFDKDIIETSFPKTGTTWLKALLYCITHRDKLSELSSLHPQHLVPSLETDIYLHNQETQDKNPNLPEAKSPGEGRIVSTHLPYQIVKDILNSSDCKVVYVTRNPKDALISLWHFVQKAKVYEKDPWELGLAVDQFCRGAAPFGPYYEHVLGYREESLKRPNKVFFVTYEELKEDTKKHVLRIAEFLECPFGKESEHEAEEIVKICSFEELSNLDVNKSSDIPKGFSMPYNSFFRKGEVGDYRNYLGKDLVGRIDGLTREKFHGAGFEYGI